MFDNISEKRAAFRNSALYVIHTNKWSRVTAARLTLLSLGQWGNNSEAASTLQVDTLLVDIIVNKTADME